MAKFLGTILIILLFLICSPLLPIKNLPRFFIVTSGSMEPLVKSGSLALTKNINPSSLKIGDIVAFSSPANPEDTVLHRISSIKSTTPLRFSTKGDNNQDEDTWDLVEGGIKGKYLFSLPYLGKIIAFIQTLFGFILVICLPALIIVVNQILKINKTVKILLPLLFILFFSLLIPSKNIRALYSSTVNTSNLTFSIVELNPPDSFLDMDDNYVRNIRNFDINAFAFDDSSVVNIKLYYSFNFNPWQEYPDFIYGDRGVFHFTSPQGDGLYSFATLATDIFGNTEIKEFDYFDYQIKVDTIPPTTNLNYQSLPTPVYSGQNYYDWTPASSLCDYNIATVDEKEVFVLGSESTSIGGTDSFFHVVSLPASASSTLTFSYRFLSHDIADFDHFHVSLTDIAGLNVLEDILNIGNLNSDDFNYDTGWISLNRGLTHLAGQTFRILFSLTDTGDGDNYNSYVFFNDIVFSTLDNRIGETSTVNFLTTDLGSEIIDTPSEIPLTTGENEINYSSSDSSENVEIDHHQSILVLSPLVLNKIDKNTIYLFNNSWDQNIDLSNYSYAIGDSQSNSLSGIVLPQQSLAINISPELPPSCQLKLFKEETLIDSVAVDDLNFIIWQRSVDGLGPWVKISPGPAVNLDYRAPVSKITLSISGLGVTLSDMSYTIDYSNSAGPQQIYGQILPSTIDVNGFSLRDLYLGTCSSGGTCTPSSGIGSSFTVTFSNLTPQTFIFN
ncbi:MAG TPA: signal peptidase I [Candidatus Woesebacteria bacterium]|nr:signal peptidase I [Candidatus Woesebacteria bacterium]